jgi:methylmalonyl-CoA epimerase
MCVASIVRRKSDRARKLGGNEVAKVIRIDHIGVAVRDVDEAVVKYQRILGAELVGNVDLTMHGNKTRAAYLKVGDGLMVMDGAVEPDGFIAKFIERRGEGLHHIALVVDDLDGYMKELEAKGVKIPHRESFGPLRREIVLSPKDLCGVVMQIIEWKEGDAPTFEKRIERLRTFLHSQ